MTHTPGPWKIHKRSVHMSLEGNCHQITNDERYPSAFVPAWDSPSIGKDDGKEEALANAYLIAAAPELLLALKEAIDFANLANNFVSNQDLPASKNWLKIVAKAEGKS